MKKTTHLLMIAAMLLSLTSAVTFADMNYNKDLNVKNVTATPLNGAAHIKWDAISSDNVEASEYEVHYGTSSVQEENSSYEHKINVGNVTEYTVTGLQNDTTYYFAVVANSADGQTSEAWSTPEPSVTPSKDLAPAGENDGKAPTIESVEPLYKDTVKVVFSKPIVLLKETPEIAFQITDSIENLYVTGAEYDPEDETDKTVLLTTAPQTKDLEYTLTIGTDIVDKYGNNVISGTSDTAIFIGVDTEKPEGDVTQPTVTDAKSTSSTTILVNFDETVSLSVDPTKDFVITGLDNPEETLEVKEVQLGNNEDGTEFASAIITTSEQKDITYTIKFENIKDLSGNIVTDQSRIFTGIKAEEVIDDPVPNEPKTDTSAPKDIAKLIAKTAVNLTKFDVKLSWTLPLETEDLASQSIYMSKNSKDNFALKTTLDSKEQEYTVGGLTAGDYYFKHTQTDTNGNESEGVITKVTLAETGPGMAGLLLLSLGAGQLSRKKKRKQ